MPVVGFCVVGTSEVGFPVGLSVVGRQEYEYGVGLPVVGCFVVG